MAKECGAERTKYGVRSVCVRPVGHHGDHTSQAGNRWAGDKPSKLATWADISANNAVADRAAAASMKKVRPQCVDCVKPAVPDSDYCVDCRPTCKTPGCPNEPKMGDKRCASCSKDRLGGLRAKTPEAWTLEDVIANIKDRLSVDVCVSRTGYGGSGNTVRVTLKWDNVAFSETSDTTPTE